MTEEDLERSLFARTFSPMGDGSLRAAILALLASAMGTGMFSFPYLAEEAGLAMVILYICLAAIFSMGSMYMIAELGLTLKVQSYGDMAELALGRGFRRLSEFCVVIYPWGITICFQVVFSKLMLELLQEAFKVKFSSDGEKELVRKLIVVGAILVNLVFIFKKDLSALRYTTLLGTSSVFYCIIAVLITCLVGGDAKDISIPSIFSNDPQRWKAVQWFRLDTETDSKGTTNYAVLQFACVATTIFCFVNHQLIFPLMNKLKRPSMRRLSKIFLRATMGELVLYLLITLTGYLFLAGHATIEGIVIENFDSVPFLVAKVLLGFTVFFAVPLGIFPAR
jgi:amino acid permease